MYGIDDKNKEKQRGFEKLIAVLFLSHASLIAQWPIINKYAIANRNSKALVKCDGRVEKEQMQ